MATVITGSTNAGPGEGAEGKKSLPRQLWQAPLFVAGVSLLIYVAATRLPGRSDSTHQLDRDFKTVRHALAHPEAELEPALAACQRAMDSAGEDRLGEAHYLLGSLYLKMAGKASGGDAAKNYQLARQYLEDAEREGVPEADSSKLTHRLGKVGFHTGDDLHRVVDRLQSTMEAADDKGEGWSLLCQAYLKLPQPDLQRALKANEQLRLVPLQGEEVLAPARLQAGEILLKLGKPEEARKVLEKVGAQAPAAVLVKARRLRARSYQDENRWAAAAALWQEALRDNRDSPAELAVFRYNLGLCLAKTDASKDAIHVWEQCLRDSKGDEGPAAALALAEYYLTEPKPEKALEPLSAAVKPVARPGEWKNSLADLKRARQVFEQAVKVYRQAGRTDLAMKAAAAYERLAVPGRAQALRAEAAAEGARARMEQSRSSKDANKLKEEAIALYRESYESYTKAADAMSRPVEGAEFLWLAAARAIDAQDPAKVAALLERFLPLDQKPERLGEGWYLLAETRRRLNEEATAIKAYQECIKHSTSYAYRARYQLALLAIKNGELDEAETALDQNLKLLRFDPDSEAQERSLFALGSLFYQRRNYPMVVRRLEEALNRFPANPEAPRARYQLADSYYVLAAQENQHFLTGLYKTAEAKEHSRKEYRRWLQKAADEYLELAKFLETPEAAGHLTPDEATQVPFVAAECKFNLGQYDEALQIYERIGSQAKGIERLNALGGMVRCLSSLGKADKVRDRLAEIRAALATMDDTIKSQWEEWLTIASKPLTK